MGAMLAAVGWIALGCVLTFTAYVGIKTIAMRRATSRGVRRKAPTLCADLIGEHLAPISADELSVSERMFPFRVRADLQRALEQLLRTDVEVRRFTGVRKSNDHYGIQLADCFEAETYDPATTVPPQYEELDVGDAAPLKCLQSGLWLVQQGASKYIVYVGKAMEFGSCGMVQRMRVQVAAANDEAGLQFARRFLEQLEVAVRKSDSYRGKILSLEGNESYSGMASGIKVHRLRTVERANIILPPSTLELLDRNVIHFVRQRPALNRLGQATKKGILFYGPPGTGKTHTIHYLAGALPGHTTLLITAEQVGLLSEYMTLARLLQPSIVVLEDVDLIARDRSDLQVGAEVLLNKLLNEMDGLNEEADILFLLTTNRPEALESALASRPGRVDQAIEFPLPDSDGRRKLVQLYACDMQPGSDVVETIVQRTERVSAAFIKELMRRSAQFHLERGESGELNMEDVESALEEMLFSGGSLNLKLLGATGADLGCNA